MKTNILPLNVDDFVQTNDSKRKRGIITHISGDICTVEFMNFFDGNKYSLSYSKESLVKDCKHVYDKLLFDFRSSYNALDLICYLNAITDNKYKFTHKVITIGVIKRDAIFCNIVLSNLDYRDLIYKFKNTSVSFVDRDNLVYN